jgi:N-acetylglucosamine-6-sulfatase
LKPARGRLGAAGSLALALVIGAAVCLPGCGSSQGDRDGGARLEANDHRPNIVLIQTDDQTASQFTREVMPRTFQLLVDKGTRFLRYFATTAECCPSRASLLTGQYAHNHGVTSNQVGYAGLKSKHEVLPVWLRDSGYRTIEVGAKYLNGYKQFAGKATDVAPGWTNWFTILSHTSYYDYRLSSNGRHEKRGDRPRDYIGRVMARKAARQIRRYAPSDRPFYLQLDERAPHVSLNRDPHGGCNRRPIPDSRDEGRFTGRKLPKPPSFNEGNISDKPAFFRRLSRIYEQGDARLLAKWQCSLASLANVDRSVAKVYRAVAAAGELDRTVFIFISDNGLFYGEHRIIEGKVFPYAAASHLPLVIRVPPRYRHDAPRLEHTVKPVGNIDLAPTILDLARAEPCAHGRCRTMDGRSLMPLLERNGHWPRDRALLSEYRVPDVARYSTCEFGAIRTRRDLYVEHYRVANPGTGDCHPTLQKERYDLQADPYELHNRCFGGTRASCPDDTLQHELDRRLDQLRDCAGIKGRDRRVHGRPFCD